MSEIVLSILICSLEKRKPQLESLCKSLWEQLNHDLLLRKVQVLFEVDNGTMPTGTKRNLLMQQATGKYVIFVDDDDAVPEYYVEELLKAAESDADCFGITRTMLTNGSNEKKWTICLGCPYIAQRDENGKEEYVRFPNHITGIKREIANKFPFAPISQGEDYNFALRMKEAGVLKTEYKIERHPMYVYDYRTNK